MLYFLRQASAFSRVVVALRAFLRGTLAQKVNIRLLHGPLSIVLVQPRDEFRQPEFVRLRVLAELETKSCELGGSFLKPIRLVHEYLPVRFLRLDTTLSVRPPERPP
ncbi:MAG: hypothetical protein ABSG79_25560 [Bryobacteraceae bacterium]